MRFQEVINNILPNKMSAAGENFAGSGGCEFNFTLQNKRRRRKIYGFRALQKGFYTEKLTIIGKIPTSRERRRRKNLDFDQISQISDLLTSGGVRIGSGGFASELY